jgi:hypothetical protein
VNGVYVGRGFVFAWSADSALHYEREFGLLRR